jgi:hypothetical protein
VSGEFLIFCPPTRDDGWTCAAVSRSTSIAIRASGDPSRALIVRIRTSEEGPSWPPPQSPTRQSRPLRRYDS